MRPSATAPSAAPDPPQCAVRWGYPHPAATGYHRCNAAFRSGYSMASMLPPEPPPPSSSSPRSTPARSRAARRCRSPPPRWPSRCSCWPAARCTPSPTRCGARSRPTRAGCSAAVGFEILSFSGYIALLWLVGERATPRMNLRASAQVTLAGAAVTRLLPTGGAGGVALTLWALRRTGLESKQATRTLLTFLVLLYAVFLGVDRRRGRPDRRRPRRRRRRPRRARRRRVARRRRSRWASPSPPR